VDLNDQVPVTTQARKLPDTAHVSSLAKEKVNMPNEFQYDVFLSHSAKDKAVVRPLAGQLRKDGRRNDPQPLDGSDCAQLEMTCGAPPKAGPCAASYDYSD
jgi:hypothetical protein